MSVILTEVAANEVKRVMQEQNMNTDEYVLKVGVIGGGCSGFTYDLGFEKKEELNEENFLTSEQHMLKVYVDKKSDLYLDGTTLDFYQELDKRGFTFDNPNSSKGCGCGKSFSCG